MASLQQFLAEQPPTTSGIHEAMARHAEAVFEEFRGILPLFLGKRQLGPFINLVLPKAVTQDGDALLETVGDLILVYELRVASFLSAVRLRFEGSEEPALGALLVTADRSKAYFQLPWALAFDANAEISSARRSTIDQSILPPEVWRRLFGQEADAEARQHAYDRLAARFGGVEELPEP